MFEEKKSTAGNSPQVKRNRDESLNKGSGLVQSDETLVSLLKDLQWKHFFPPTFRMVDDYVANRRKELITAAQD